MVYTNWIRSGGEIIIITPALSGLKTHRFMVIEE